MNRMQQRWAWLGWVVLVQACGGGGGRDARDTGRGDVGALGSDAEGRSDVEEPGALFGVPNDKTGLTAQQCQPYCARCADGVAFQAPVFDAARLEGLRAWRELDAPGLLEGNPYDVAAEAVPEEAVCAVVVVDHVEKTYQVQNFPNRLAAEAAGGVVTHFGVCGRCSSLADLAVYAGTPDLTEPVRACGVRGLSGGHEELRACIEELGFSTACADIWAYNTTHTREKCFAICFELLQAPYHEADGSLNACLRCDEEESGAVFKAVAGRTRRNTGIASSMCRPCSEVRAIEHHYE